MATSVIGALDADGTLAARWSLGFEDMALRNSKPAASLTDEDSATSFSDLNADPGQPNLDNSSRGMGESHIRPTTQTDLTFAPIAILPV